MCRGWVRPPEAQTPRGTTADGHLGRRPEVRSRPGHSRPPTPVHLLGPRRPGRPRRPRRPGTAPPWPVLPAAAGRRADRSALRSLKSNRLLHTAPISQSSETSPFDNPVRSGHRAGRGDGSLRTTQTKPRSRDGFRPETTSACYQSPGSSQHLCARVRTACTRGTPTPSDLRRPSCAREMRATSRGQVNVLKSKKIQGRESVQAEAEASLGTPDPRSR